MAANKNPYRTFPTPIEGPNVPYKAAQESNPILRGRVLEIAATLVQSSSFIQSILWRNAGFSTIRDIQDLTAYEPKFDPTVLPPLIQQSGTETPELPAPTRRRQDGKGDYYTSADYRELYKTGKLTPTAVVEALLPAIRRDTSPPGEFSEGFSQSKIDLVRASAEASTQRWANGTPLGPMDGIPVAIKDEVDIDGYDKYLSSKVNFTANPSFTSWCVKKWEEAGAIVIGKTVMHEIGLDTTNNNPVVGTPRNPHNPGYYTGGSSGGSGYAVGAGIVPLALGADGGGSIRIPSNYCGIYGLKTTHGRVSAAPTRRLATTVGVFGPMASNIDDLAMGYRIMSAPDPNNPVSAAFPDPLLSIPSPSSSRGKVIGVYKDWVERSNPDVLATFNKAIDYYRDEQGYEIVDITIPYIPEGGKCHALSILNEISSGLTKKQISQLSAPTRIVVSVGGTQGLAQDYFASQRMRHLLMNHLSFLFQKYPGLVIATPTTPTAGSKISGGEADLTNGISDSNATLQSMEYVYLANFTGCPAISCPMGYDDEPSVPVGLMGMGEWGSEEALMEWARDGEGMLGDKGLRAPNKEKGGKWIDAINLALNPSTD
ncbi:N-acylethanolamine amidohydrolase [Trichophyton interdigitale]|uniref:N-acylethanolamine amidohydrolase n=1 Tax=Trichophyton interdigitale TaxID=101480 RepID=A0A9P4YK79_9EURO|nr:N-acylethanolamine amidohydrolase [Trichophyton interdigitale]KAF3900079.1 N-acylethanolamine amidohydrolase [Trichophyton interdigitale]KAG8208592.1 N-acylethanolamine amidohydrolase [Trichophyton interdigitale]